MSSARSGVEPGPTRCERPHPKCLLPILSAR